MEVSRLGRILRLSVASMDAQKRSEQVGITLRQGACSMSGLEVRRLVQELASAQQEHVDLSQRLKQVCDSADAGATQ
jgi:hypothetical protein